MIVHAGFEDDKGSEVDSDYSEDEGLASEDEGDLGAELDDIRDDQDLPREDMEGDSHDEQPGPTTNGISSQQSRITKRRQSRPAGLGLRASSSLLDENGNLVSHKSSNRLLQMLEGDELAEPESLTPKKRRRLNADAITHRKNSVRTRKAVGSNDSGRFASVSGKSVRFDESEQPTPATVRLGSSEESEDDDNFELVDDADSESDETDESDKENATPGSQKAIVVTKSSKLIQLAERSPSSRIQEPAAKSDSSSSSESDSDDDETSSSEASSSEASESSGGSSSSGDEDVRGDQEASSSSGTSSSSSDEEQSPPKQSSSKEAVLSQTSKAVPLVMEKEADSGSQEPKVPVPPGAGKKATQKRNQRRRDRVKLIRLQRQGVLPPKTSTVDLRNLNECQTGQSQEDKKRDSVSGEDGDAETEQKRQGLLQAISSGGIDQDEALAAGEIRPEDYAAKPSPDSKATEKSRADPAAIEKSGSSASQRTLIDTSSIPQKAGEVITRIKPVQPDEDASLSLDPIIPQVPTIASASQSSNDILPSAQKPRAKLDKDSSRRLVFGALGLRTPKTPEDGTKLRAKLMKDTEQAKKPAYQKASEDPGTKPPRPAYDASWEDKIELSAVECCYDGIELSTPPFPFVQRWDPHQKKGYFDGESNFSRNTKKRKRNNKHYEASFEPVADESSSKRQQRRSYDAKVYHQDEHEALPGVSQRGGAHSTSDDNLQAANDQLLRETEETFANTPDESDLSGDLPQLPEDLSAYPNLEQGACSAGAIIAFKQLDMSADTNWQPNISDYRTAIVVDLLHDGTLGMRMAARDRPGGDKRYDQETGERLYSKFEMPGFNEDDTEDNDGLLELAFAELIEPKLVKATEKEYESLPTSEETPDTNFEGNEVIAESHMEVMKDDKGLAPFADVTQESLEDVQNFITDAEATEQVRKEIHDLIKDAGWRSSIQSNASVRHDNPDFHQVEDDFANTEGAHETHEGAFISPRFDGFSSSPPAEEYQEADEQVVYPTIRGMSSPTGHDGTTDNVDQTTADPSSEADHEATQALRQDFEKELHQPIILSTPDEPSDSPEQAESSTLLFEDAQPQSTPPPGGTDSLKSTIPDSQPPNPGSNTHTTTTVDVTANSQDSDSDFPSLEIVFTSFASQRDAIKNENRSSDDEEGTSILQSRRSHRAKVNGKNNHSTKTDGLNKINNQPPPASAPPSVPAHNPKSSKPSKANTNSSNARSRLNRYDPAPRSSQDWIGTQIVDLTMSSDPAAAAMEEEEAAEAEEYINGSTTGGDSLPKGPGWVKKNKGRTKAR